MEKFEIQPEQNQPNKPEQVTGSEQVAEKAMEKVVDIFIEKDLKYRDSYDPIKLARDLETGLITLANAVFFDKSGATIREGLVAAKKLRKRRIDFSRSTNKMTPAAYHTKRYEDKEHEHEEYLLKSKSNVFYPDGVLKVVKDALENPGAPDSSIVLDKFNAAQIIGTFLSICESKIKEKEPIIGEEVLFALHKALGAEAEFGSMFRTKRVAETKKILSPRAAKKWFLKNYEEIRRKFLKVFLETTYSGEQKNPVYHKPEIGFILSGNVPAYSSFNDDYPTQASLASVKNKRNIIGLFINDELGRVGNFDSEGEAFPDAKGIETYGPEFKTNEGEFLRNIHFRNSPQIFWRYFESLTGKSREEILAKNPVVKKVIDEIELLDTQLNQKGAEKDEIFEKTPQASGGGGMIFKSKKDENRWEKLRRESDKLYEKIQQRKATLSKEEQSAFNAVINEYLEKYTPFRDDQSAWDMIMALAEQNSLPVYNFRGNLLWPKELSRGEVVKFLADKK